MITELLRNSLLANDVDMVSELTASQVLASQVTDLFFFIVLVLFLLSVVARHKDRFNEFVSYTPTLLTSMGILGTFAGILIGLMAFDTQDIDGSIASLLWGMQTAFITSIWGILLSILFKVYISLTTPDSVEQLTEETAAQETHSHLTRQTELLQRISSSISDQNSDASLVNVMKLSRSDTNDFRKLVATELSKLVEMRTSVDGMHELMSNQLKQQESLVQMFELQMGNFKSFEERLWRNLQEFADMMSKSATEQVIEALKQVISDFNNNLTEQFGENFKQLNQAVSELVTWQENYKIQLLEMTTNYAEGVKAISQTEKSVANISQQSAQIPVAMGELKSVLEVNQHQIAELERHLEAFKSIRDKAVEAVPEIEARIDQTIKGVEVATANLSTGLEKSAEKLSNAIIKTADEFDNNVTRVNGSLQQSSDYLSEKSEELKQQLLDSVQQVREDFIDLIDSVKENNSQISSAHKQSVNDIQNNYQQVASQFESIFNDVTSNVSTQLTKLSDAFYDSVNKSISSSDDSQQKLLTHHEKVVSDFSSNFKDIQKKMESHLTDLVNEVSKSVENSVQEQISQTGAVRKTLQNYAEETMSDTAEAVKYQVRMIDSALEKELNKSMQELGNSLAAITKQFTQDYSSLVNEMQKVVSRR